MLSVEEWEKLRFTYTFRKISGEVSRDDGWCIIIRVVLLSSEFSPLLYITISFSCGIINKEDTLKRRKLNSCKSVGTGPFRLTYWNSGMYWVWTFWRYLWGKPEIDELVFKSSYQKEQQTYNSWKKL